MDLEMLRDKIKDRGLKIGDLAAKIDIDRASLYRKLNNFQKLTIGEAQRIKNALELSDEEALQIFLN